jgi:virulence plasmid B protein/VCBS repeat protein
VRARFCAFLIGLGFAAVNGAAIAAAEPVNTIPIDVTLPRSRPASFNPAVAPPLPTLPQTISAGMGTQSLLSGLPTVTGRTAGGFAVSATGAATYSIPLWTPPGVRGINPSLALAYSSNSGNGLLGVGWSLAGFSTVERCNRTYAQDSVGGAPQLDSTDRFCLDGNRLRSVSGTYGADLSTYQTEIANFSKVISHGTAGSGPAWFEVLGKNGLTYEYGHTTDSAILASGATSVRVWALSLVKDRIGNSMKFVYTNDTTNGSYRPLRIEYTYAATYPSTHYYEVGFTYQTRTADGLWEYSEGGKNNEFNLISQIAAKAWDGSSQAIVKSYTFDYATAPATSRSRLTTIQECSPSDCLKPTTIGYQDGQTGWGSEIVGSGYTGLSAVLPIDVNGDGLEDLVYPNSATSTFYYALGTTAGSYSGPYNTGVSSTSYTAAIPCDYNSDGKMDVLVPNTSGNWRVLFFSSAGGSFTFTDTATSASGAASGWVTSGDLDGDGRDDLIYLVSGGSGFASIDRVWGRLNTGSGFSSTATLLYQTSGTTGNWNKFGLNPLGATTYAFQSRVRRADFNGDGRVDFQILIRNCQADQVGQCGGPGTLTYTWSVLLSKADGTYARLGIAGFGQTGVPTRPPVLGDFNGTRAATSPFQTVPGIFSTARVGARGPQAPSPRQLARRCLITCRRLPWTGMVMARTISCSRMRRGRGAMHARPDRASLHGLH